MVRRSPSAVVLVVVPLVVLALAAGVAWAVTGPGQQVLGRADVRGPLASALAVAPADTTVLGFTDWDRIRDSGVTDPATRDLATRSALSDIGEAVPQAFGWSIDDVRWEAFVQDLGAGVLVVAPGDALSWSEVEDGLREAGFDQDGDGWSATPQVLTETGLGDQFTAVRIVRSAGVLVAATAPEAADQVVRTATGRDASLATVRQAADTAQALAGADTVLLQAGSLGCDAAAVPDTDRAAADAAQAREGRLQAYSFAGRALTDRGGSGASAQTATFAMTFDDVSTAREQAPIRERLATGPFIGRTGQVEDELRDPSATVDQATVTLSFDRSADGTVLMLGTGALLFAAC
ncbi:MULTISPECIES: hypothetical protein [unclassified Aeromicrobium]|uniref:hypothetical protein n=1 Tax=unclassified Aeromicrobium TaxID=2633570 RepID=UPI00288AB4E4|nr:MULTISPECIES: hypothetical protein [unclassified Aeromicrobium]